MADGGAVDVDAEGGQVGRTVLEHIDMVDDRLAVGVQLLGVEDAKRLVGPEGEDQPLRLVRPLADRLADQPGQTERPLRLRSWRGELTKEASVACGDDGRQERVEARTADALVALPGPDDRVHVLLREAIEVLSGQVALGAREHGDETGELGQLSPRFLLGLLALLGLLVVRAHWTPFARPLATPPLRRHLQPLPRTVGSDRRRWVCVHAVVRAVTAVRRWLPRHGLPHCGLPRALHLCQLLVCLCEPLACRVALPGCPPPICRLLLEGPVLALELS